MIYINDPLTVAHSLPRVYLGSSLELFVDSQPFGCYRYSNYKPQVKV